MNIYVFVCGSILANYISRTIWCVYVYRTHLCCLDMQCQSPIWHINLTYVECIKHNYHPHPSSHAPLERHPLLLITILHSCRGTWANHAFWHERLMVRGLCHHSRNCKHCSRSQWSDSHIFLVRYYELWKILQHCKCDFLSVIQLQKI